MIFHGQGLSSTLTRHKGQIPRIGSPQKFATVSPICVKGAGFGSSARLNHSQRGFAVRLRYLENARTKRPLGSGGLQSIKDPMTAMNKSQPV